MTMGIYTDHFNDNAELKQLREENFELIERLQRLTRDYSILLGQHNTKLKIKEVIAVRATHAEVLKIINVHNTENGVVLEVEV